MKNKFILFLCIYLASAVLVLGLILPHYNSARQAVSNDNAAYIQDGAAYNAAYENDEVAFENDVAQYVSNDRLQLSVDMPRLTRYENMLYVYALISVAYWIIVVGLLIYLKPKDVQANG